MMIDLPFPHKLLWPNGSVGNRHAKNRETKKHREWAHIATLEALGGAPGFVPTSITIHVHAKAYGRLPDKDNCIAAAKSSFDGIADALKVNDRDFPEPKVIFSEIRDGRFEIEVNRDATSGSSHDSVHTEKSPITGQSQ